MNGLMLNAFMCINHFEGNNLQNDTYMEMIYKVLNTQICFMFYICIPCS